MSIYTVVRHSLIMHPLYIKWRDILWDKTWNGNGKLTNSLISATRGRVEEVESKVECNMKKHRLLKKANTPNTVISYFVLLIHQCIVMTYMHIAS